MQEFAKAIAAGASEKELKNIPLPETYRAAFVKKDEISMFKGLPTAEKDPRKSLHVDEVPDFRAIPR